MEILTSVLLISTSIIFFLLVTALILPKKYTVTVNEIINASKDEVLDYVSQLNNQLIYSEWLNSDDSLITKIVGTDGTKGAVLNWESHNRDKNRSAGKGEQEIIHISEDYIEVELRLLLPMAATCKLEHFFEAVSPSKTIYTCTFHAYAKFPINLPSYLFGRQFIKKTQLKTLNNIKEILEKSHLSI